MVESGIFFNPEVVAFPIGGERGKEREKFNNKFKLIKWKILLWVLQEETIPLLSLLLIMAL